MSYDTIFFFFALRQEPLWEPPPHLHRPAYERPCTEQNTSTGIPLNQTPPIKNTHRRALALLLNLGDLYLNTWKAISTAALPPWPTNHTIRRKNRTVITRRGIMIRFSLTDGPAPPALTSVHFLRAITNCPANHKGTFRIFTTFDH